MPKLLEKPIHSYYVAFTKLDEEKRTVGGYASTEAVDSDGQIVTKEAISGALDDYMKFANLREMHGMSAAGTVTSAQMDDNGLLIEAKVVDEEAWLKVKEGVYKGFSIGGKVKKKVGNRITQIGLSEISLVDRPANPEAMIDFYKAEGDKVDAELSKSYDTSMTDNMGMMNVSELASVIRHLCYLRDCVIGEEQAEGDDSGMPAKIEGVLEMLGALLVEMASHETAEITHKETTMTEEEIAAAKATEEATKIVEEKPTDEPVDEAAKVAKAEELAKAEGEKPEEKPKDGEGSPSMESARKALMDKVQGHADKIKAYKDAAKKAKTTEELDAVHKEIACYEKEEAVDEESKKAEKVDFAKMVKDALAKVSAPKANEEIMLKMAGALAGMQAEIAELRKAPAPVGKAMAKAVTISKEEDAALLKSEKVEKDLSPRELIMGAHQSGGARIG